MASSIDICNLALAKVSAPAIQSLSESSKEARECNKIYEFIRDAVLADHDWGFARKQQALAELDEDYYGWDYGYSWPTDCLVPRKIYDSTDGAVPIAFESATTNDLDGRVILTDQEDAILIYTSKITNVNLFEPMFIDATAHRMAAALAPVLRGDKQLSALFWEIYRAIISRAKAVNANADKKNPTDSSSFSRARA